MKKRRFLVTVEKSVVVEFDDRIMPNDDWRKQFYNIQTPQQLAEHIGYNFVANDIDKLSDLDGFADQKDSRAKVEDGSWDVESREIGK